MTPLVRLGWRSLSRNRRFSLLFLVNLALGLTGFLLVGSFGASLGRHVDGHLKEILSGDLILQASRPLTERELEISRDIAGPGSRFSRQIALYTMVKAGGLSKLAQIVAIDEAFPLYGGFGAADGSLTYPAAEELQHRPLVLLSRETARSSGLAPGGTLTIGQAQYTVAPLFDREPGNDFTSLTLAPRMYLGLPQLEASGLIRFGSRISYKHFIRLPDSADSTAVAARLTAALEQLTKTPEVRVATTTDVNRRMGRVVGYFGAFLGLAAMVSLALAALTAAYLFREHLHGQMREIAVLLSLGASHRQCLLLAAGQLVLLGLIAAGAAAALTWLLLPLFGGLFAGLVPAGLTVALDPQAAALAVLVGVLGSLLFCLPGLLRILTVRPFLLLQDQAAPVPDPGRSRAKTAAALAPALILLLLLTLHLSHSPLQGILFTAGLAGLIALFTLAAALLFLGCRRWAATDRLFWRLAWRNLYRNRSAGTAMFVALATALLLVNLIPQVEKGLAMEIGQPEGIELPDLFLIDIQEEQRQPLSRFFQEEESLLSELSPMVQGRIVSINGQPFARWRQEHQSGDERGLRRTEFNFSSRARLDASETVIAGPELPTTPWQMETNQPFALSMEQEFSKRLQVGIGDRLVVDIQGVELEGRIVNLRKVRWNSFQPNFFMLAQPGVLDGAPATYLASVSRVGQGEKDALINRLTAAFPNISALDVSGTIGQMVRLAGQMTRSLRFMAGLAMTAGLLTVVVIARQEALRREREINLLRVLGAERNTIRALLVLEFAVIAAAAALIALVLSVLCALGLSWLLFDRLWQFQWQSGLFLLLAAIFACSLTALTAADSVIRRPPAALLH